MKISQVIETLKQIQVEFGDIAITGGAMQEDYPLRTILVTEKGGMEIWPHDPNGITQDPKYKIEIDGVFFQ
jgi:hypothetical protein